MVRYVKCIDCGIVLTQKINPKRAIICPRCGGFMDFIVKHRKKKPSPYKVNHVLWEFMRDGVDM